MSNRCWEFYGSSWPPSQCFESFQQEGSAFKVETAACLLRMVSRESVRRHVRDRIGSKKEALGIWNKGKRVQLCALWSYTEVSITFQDTREKPNHKMGRAERGSRNLETLKVEMMSKWWKWLSCKCLGQSQTSSVWKTSRGWTVCQSPTLQGALLYVQMTSHCNTRLACPPWGWHTCTDCKMKPFGLCSQ